MNVQRPIAIVALLIGLEACYGVAAANSNESAASRQQVDAISEEVEEFRAKYKVPGMAVAFVRDDQLTYLSYGVESLSTQAEVSPDTLFEVGSVSKTFTATLAAYAAREGRLSLDEPVAEYVPELSGVPLGNVPLWQLGVHSAGGFPLQFPEGLDNAGAMAYYKRWQPKFPGGAVRSYANPSIALLSVATARAMKVTYRSAMQDLLFPKLGLQNTWLKVPDKKMGMYAQGYNANSEPVRLEDGPFAEEAYGVRSSARDLLAFLKQNIEPDTGDKSLDQALRDVRRPYYEVGSMLQGLIWESYRYPTDASVVVAGSAPGFSLKDQEVTSKEMKAEGRGELLFNKTGGTGGFGTYIVFVPSRKIGVVVLTNHANPTVERVALGLKILEIVDQGRDLPRRSVSSVDTAK